MTFVNDPTTKELLERIKKIDAVATAMASESAEQRKDIEEIRHVISFMAERFETIQNHILMLFRAERNQNERLLGLEKKVFPTMWETIDRAESIVGDLDTPHEDSPLDRREEKP